MSIKGQGNSETLDLDSHILRVLSISSKTSGPVVTKFHLKPPGVEKTKICSHGPGHMTNMIQYLFMVNTFKVFFSRINGLMVLTLDF